MNTGRTQWKHAETTTIASTITKRVHASQIGAASTRLKQKNRSASNASFEPSTSSLTGESTSRRRIFLTREWTSWASSSHPGGTVRLLYDPETTQGQAHSRGRSIAETSCIFAASGTY